MISFFFFMVLLSQFLGLLYFPERGFLLLLNESTDHNNYVSLVKKTEHPVCATTPFNSYFIQAFSAFEVFKVLYRNCIQCSDQLKRPFNFTSGFFIQRFEKADNFSAVE